MHIHICAGKGGVGKTFAAVSLAVFLSRIGQKTAIMDYDGGHSVCRTLGIVESILENEIYMIDPNLGIIIMGDVQYQNIADAKAEGVTMRTYLAQFRGSLGTIPLHDMIFHFWGLVPDMETLQKFAILADMLPILEEKGFDHIIIDVEPTAGLKRLLSHADKMVQGLRNLHDQGITSLTMLRVKWPDIASYLRSPYIRHFERHESRLENMVQRMKAANYTLVCIPEDGPVNQMAEIRAIISQFGGTTRGYIINNARDEKSEEVQIARVRAEGLPTVIIPHITEMHTGHDRTSILLETGRILFENLLTTY